MQFIIIIEFEIQYIRLSKEPSSNGQRRKMATTKPLKLNRKKLSERNVEKETERRARAKKSPVRMLNE